MTLLLKAKGLLCTELQWTFEYYKPYCRRK